MSIQGNTPNSYSEPMLVPGVKAVCERSARDKARAEVRAQLTPGEYVVWDGAPRWQTIACNVFHVRMISAYFVAYAVFQSLAVITGGGTVAAALFSGAVVAILSLPAVGILCGFAWLIEHTTLYSVTSRRVVLGVGVALPKTLNIPFSMIESVSVKSQPNGTGNISLKLMPTARIASLLLWPHLRPWRIKIPEPTLRGVANAANVASILAQALRSTEDRCLAKSPFPPARMRRSASPLAVNANAAESRVILPLPMRLAAMLAVLSLALVIIYQHSNPGTPNNIPHHPTTSRWLQFTLESDGHAVVTDAATSEILTRLGSGDDGIIYGALRAFLNERSRSGLPLNVPLQLVRWDDGRITLSDPLLGDHVPLNAFGPMGPGATKDLLTIAAAPARVDKHGSPVATVSRSIHSDRVPED